MPKPETLNVRGIYFDLDRGLFLIQTEKSKMRDSWTTPGGGLSLGEDPVFGLNRIVESETGMEISSIEPAPFYRSEFIRRHDAQPTKVLAYSIKIHHLSMNGCVEGETPAGLDFKFFDICSLLSRRINITRTTYEIVLDRRFLDKIEV